MSCACSRFPALTSFCSLHCSGINKPVAVQDWMMQTNPQEDYILILDADMIMLKPFDPIKMGVAPGKVLADCNHCCLLRVQARS